MALLEFGGQRRIERVVVRVVEGPGEFLPLAWLVGLDGVLDRQSPKVLEVLVVVVAKRCLDVSGAPTPSDGDVLGQSFSSDSQTVAGCSAVGVQRRVHLTARIEHKPLEVVASPQHLSPGAWIDQGRLELVDAQVLMANVQVPGKLAVVGSDQDLLATVEQRCDNVCGKGAAVLPVATWDGIVQDDQRRGQ